MKALFSPIRMHHRTVASGIANRISGQRRVIRGVIFGEGLLKLNFPYHVLYSVLISWIIFTSACNKYGSEY